MIIECNLLVFFAILPLCGTKAATSEKIDRIGNNRIIIILHDFAMEKVNSAGSTSIIFSNYFLFTTKTGSKQTPKKKWNSKK